MLENQNDGVKCCAVILVLILGITKSSGLK